MLRAYRLPRLITNYPIYIQKQTADFPQYILIIIGPIIYAQ